MKKNFAKFIALTTILLLAVPFIMGVGLIKERKIVIFKTGVSNEKRAKIVKIHGGEKVQELGLVNGQSIMLPVGKAAALAAMPEVLRVEDDVLVTTQVKPGTSAIPPAEAVPWGIKQINADQCWSNNTGDSVKVAVVDTGISTGHPDLAANLKGGASFVSYTTNYNDDNGHGSHVAGIIAALDNEIGVVGVGPKIDLYAVKVLDRKGSGTISGIIKGLEWCVNNNVQVVNMSLGSSIYSQALADAVINVNNAGIVQVAAAGNSGGEIIYPAALPEVIAVGATADSDNNLAYFSCIGPQLDLVAPGVSIKSSYKGTAYATMSGTSMASPHVAGVAALVIQSGKAILPAEVQTILESTATNLGGDSGKDIYFGSGLVDAVKAIQ